MKKVVLVSLFAALVSQATGCIITSGDDTNGSDVNITATWDIKSISGAEVGCPSGYDTAALYSQEIDDNYNNVGVPVVDLFDCTATVAVSAPLNPTTYYSWIQIENHDGSSVYASTVDAFIDLTTTNKTFAATILSDGGYFELTWTLTQGGIPTSCAANPNIDGVEAISTEVGNANNAVSDIFQCSDHNGVTAGLPAGNYTISVDAFHGSATTGTALGTADPISNSIQTQNKVTNLGSVTIPLD